MRLTRRAAVCRLTLLLAVAPFLRPAVLAASDAWTTQTLRIQGSFAPTLYATLAQAIPDSVLGAEDRDYMAWEIADIFRWEVDFTRDLHPGDTYRIVFERLLLPFGEVRYGRVLAAELVLGRDTLTAYEFDDSRGRTAFYDAAGESLHRSFLRVPVAFKRISSGFSAARLHPILHRWRAHRGIDYAASRGTPVMAAGDGVVTFVGSAGGYGNMVELRHADGITTRYGHLQRFAKNLRVGRTVSQGDCIGYVGSTGLATGPHLHFEFRIHGKASDPRVLAREEGAPIAPDSRAAFASQVDRLNEMLYVHGRSLASR